MAASIKGLHKTTLVDFPPYVSCTIFISTCNFRCGFCHNKDLVENSRELREYSEEEILKFLESKKKILDGVCITGGEPTLYSNLTELIKKIKNKGFKVKLDTNGTNPELLRELLDRKLLDYVAMDIKASKDRYDDASDSAVDIDMINQSIDILKDSGIDYEFRTTAVPGIIDEASIRKIGEWIKGAKKYALQQFNPSRLIDDEFESKKPYDMLTLQKFTAIMKGYAKEVELRA